MVQKGSGQGTLLGPWSDPDGALNKWLEQKDDLLAGREPSNGEGLTVKVLVNTFLTSKKRLVESGELSERTWDDYDFACRQVIESFGKSRLVSGLRPIDFERLRADFAKTHGPIRLCKDITYVRMLFKYGYDADLMERPIKFGPTFTVLPVV